jgi:cold shock CspA family protein
MMFWTVHIKLRMAVCCRSIEREGQPALFFHISEVAGGSASGVGNGSEVSFSVIPDPASRTEKFNAVALELLPPGTIAEERIWPGKLHRLPFCSSLVLYLAISGGCSHLGKLVCYVMLVE